MKKEDNLQTFFVGDGIAILTENADGKMYMLRAKSLEDITADWEGECEFVPANDDKVFFASCNSTLVNAYRYGDFGTLLMYLKECSGNAERKKS